MPDFPMWGTWTDTFTGKSHVYRRTEKLDIEAVCDEWDDYMDGRFSVDSYADSPAELKRYSCRKCAVVMRALGVAA